MKDPKEKQKRNTKGITLIALVITIIVLLILAGVALSSVLSEDGIFSRASKSAVITEIAKVEETAKMIYSEKIMDNAENDRASQVETSEVITKLQELGYHIEKRPVAEGDITGISLDKTSLTMGKNKTAEIKVTYEGAEDPFVYYLEVQDNYYQMHSKKGDITIDKIESGLTSSDFEGAGGESAISNALTITTSPSNIITAVLKEGSTNTIEISSSETEGDTTVTVKYGHLEPKMCTVKVIEPILATGISLDKPNGTVTGGLSYTEDLKLTVTLEPVNVTEKEVTWTSNNPELATVDCNGNVKAGAKGGNVIITATTKDGTNLSAKCDVIVEIFGAVDNSTRDYTDTKDNKTIKIPGGFAVGTSENVSKIENGLVIQDNKGNQFVWVPVDNSNEMFEVANDQNVGILYNFSGTSSTRKKYSTSGYREPDVVVGYDDTESYYTNAGIMGITNATQFKAQQQNEFNSMKISVETNKGFYIGRYETGDLSKTTAVSKRNNNDINRKNWYTQYQKGKTVVTGENVTSSMIWGCQWDATMRWFQKSSNTEVAKFPTDSTGKGNHTGTQGSTNKIISTGSNTNYMVNNIYDMAGNVWEWTREVISSYRVCRRSSIFIWKRC